MRKYFFLLTIVVLGLTAVSCNDEPLKSVPSIETGKVSGITERTATITATITHDGGDPLIARGVCYNVTPDPTIEHTRVEEMINIGVGNFSIELKFLTHDTKYYARPFARNAQGVAYGEQIEFTTLRIYAAPKVTTIAASKVDYTTATIGGNVTEEGDKPLTEVGVVYGEAENPTLETAAKVVTASNATGAFSCDITELKEATTYYFKAFATNELGTTYGAQMSFITKKTTIITNPSGLDNLIVGTTVNLGSPFPVTVSSTTYNSAVTKQGDKHIFCVVSGGDPSVLSIIDIENPHAPEILETYDVMVGNVWANLVDSKGNYYFGGYLGGTEIYRYAPNNPEGKRLELLGTQRGAVTAMTVDNNDNVYFTNHTVGTIVKYDAATNTFTDYGRVSNTTGSEHVRSIAYYNGYLYCGQQKTGAAFFRFNLNTRQVEYLTNPTTGITVYYTMKIVRHYLFVYTQGEANIMSVYDLQQGKWVHQEPTGGLYPTGEIDGFVYFTGTNQSIKKINLETLQSTATGVTLTNHGLRGVGIANLTAASPFTGKFFVSILATSGHIDFINFDTETRHRVSNVVPGANVVIQNFGFLGDDYYASAYNSNLFSKTNIHTGVRQTHSMGQVEGMMAYNGKMYTGVYPNARIYEYNPATNISTQLIGIAQGQDRPFQVKVFDNKLVIGTISAISELGGALTVYDLNTKELSVHRNIIQDQGITGIAYKDGKVYGSSTVSGGLGTTPTQTRAKLFVYDVNTKAKIKEVTPTFSLTSSAVNFIGELCFAPDGKLWGAAGGIVFEIDPETLAIKSEKRLSNYQYFGTWRPVYMYFDDNGIMFVNPGSDLIAFDPNTGQFKNLAPNAAGRVSCFVMNDARNTIIFGNSTFKAQAFRLDISRN